LLKTGTIAQLSNRNRRGAARLWLATLSQNIPQKYGLSHTNSAKLKSLLAYPVDADTH
jgi:hypothetical protein